MTILYHVNVNYADHGKQFFLQHFAITEHNILQLSNQTGFNKYNK